MCPFASTSLHREFYLQETTAVARQLLGKRIIRRLASGETLSGIIVETEAYLTGDPASHSFRGATPRNRAMFGPPGHAYVYLSYGLHAMLNVVCGPEGVGEAVLIRAVEPVNGVETMRRLRGGVIRERDLTNGPGKLAQALGLTHIADNSKDLTDPASDITIVDHRSDLFEVVEAARIGISQGTESPWRFYIRGNPFVSRP